ncbi:hypothetical protein ANCDUO_01685 [Ancylostoma duodenale]|uniref:Alpha/beta hydrolase fold-3 domain-containing protein n=1 Tax=Ancylostoma duodenale TaxID=51022 RepID=A0A0C2H2G9_9BILA|nr:hypothetical protein ANCDUO_01685 [Ancylostoma duodenale]
MDPNPALTHLYSCSRWSGLDPNKVIADYVRIGEETCEQLRKTPHVENLPYSGPDTTNSLAQIDIWGEVKDHLVIFLHGGFWQEGTRKVVSPAAVNLVKRSITMAAVGYDYASPTHPLSQVVQEVVTATEFLLSKYPQVRAVTLAGHSAGAQLAFKESYFTSSCFRLTPEEAKKDSCSASELEGLNIRVQILIAGKDSPKLIEQNRAMVNEMKNHGIAIEAHVCSPLSVENGSCLAG